MVTGANLRNASEVPALPSGMTLNPETRHAALYLSRAAEFHELARGYVRTGNFAFAAARLDLVVAYLQKAVPAGRLGNLPKDFFTTAALLSEAEANKCRGQGDPESEALHLCASAGYWMKADIVDRAKAASDNAVSILKKLAKQQVMLHEPRQAAWMLEHAVGVLGVVGNIGRQQTLAVELARRYGHLAESAKAEGSIPTYANDMLSVSKFWGIAGEAEKCQAAYAEFMRATELVRKR